MQNEFTVKNVREYMKLKSLTPLDVKLISSKFKASSNLVRDMMKDNFYIDKSVIYNFLMKNDEEEFSVTKLRNLFFTPINAITIMLENLEKDNLVQKSIQKNGSTKWTVYTTKRIGIIAAPRIQKISNKAWTPPAQMTERLNPERKSQICLSSHVAIPSIWER